MRRIVMLMLSMVVSIAAWSEVGDTFTEKTAEGVDMSFKVISEVDKTCQVGVGLGFSVTPSIPKETTGTITVPASVRGYKVTTLAVNAFADCSGITTINIPNGLTYVGANAVESTQWYKDQPDGVVYLGYILCGWKGTMTDNTSVDVKEGTTVIAESAFRNYSKLQSVTMPESLISIGSSAFSYCSGLKSITIHEGLRAINSEAFSGCTSLTSFTIPNTVTTIGSSAFSGCSQLSTIVIPDGVTYVGANAFKNTQWLSNQQGLVYIGTIAYKYNGSIETGTNVDIKEGTTAISAECFRQCSKLASVTIPTSLTTIGKYAFWNCSSLSSIDLPNNVETIGWGAFGWCTSLTSIKIPNKVKTIENSTFVNCTSLQSVSIPASVTNINIGAFNQNPNITSISIDSNNPVYDSRANSNAIIETATNTLLMGCNGTVIPDGVKKIRANAFVYATGLTEITFPKSVTEIGTNLFASQNAVTSITVLSKTPPTVQEYAFTDVKYSATLYVPYGCKTVYQAASYWDFTTITELEKDPTGTESKPFTCAEANEFVSGLTADQATETEYYIKGKVCEMQENFSYKFGNATFRISDDGTDNGSFTVFRTKYFEGAGYAGGRVPNIGDEVVLCGKLINYQGTTPETASNRCRLVSLNNKTVGTDLEVGELFVAKTAEDVEMVFVVDSYTKPGGGTNDVACSVGYAVGNRPETYTNAPACIDANYNGAITIPETAGGFPVQVIAPSAFANTKITSVSMPASIWNIETRAFSGCTQLASVNLPQGVTLNASTFENCTSLTSVELPKNVTLYAISDMPIFKGCTNLTSITVNDETPFVFAPDDVNYLVDDPGKVTLNVPAGSVSAYQAADYWKKFKEIKEFYISPAIVFADANVKAVCVANWDTNKDGELSEAEAAEVTSLGNAFIDNKAIKTFDEISYFTGVKALKEKEFLGCTGLERFTLPGWMTLDGYSIFSGCTSLKSFVMEPVTGDIEHKWSSSVFSGCTSLETAVVHGEYLHGPDNFEYCANLKTVTFISNESGNSYNQNFHDAATDIQFVIPEGTAEDFLRNGYVNLSDKGALGILREEFETEEAAIARMPIDNTVQKVMNQALVSVNEATDYAPIFNQISVIKQAAKEFVTTTTLKGVVDVTGAYITNPDFDHFDIGWKTPTGWITAGYKGDGHCENGDVVMDKFIELWSYDELGDYQFSQTLSQLPAGTYRLEADAIASWREDGRDISGAYLYIGDQQKAVANQGAEPKHYTVEFVNAETKDIEIGMKTMGTNANWIAADNFRLYYIGDETENAVEATDISKLTDAVYSNAANGSKGTTARLSISLKNAKSTNAYSFDLVLPDGVTLATDDKGDYICSLSNRHNGQTPTINNKSTGVYSFAVFSLSGSELSDNDGVILTLKVNIADNVDYGDYAVKIQNAKYSLPSGAAKVAMPETVGVLTVANYLKGDVNGDGDVDIADAVCIVNHVVGKPTPMFVAAAADVNGDGDIDIADAVRIVNLVVGKISALARQRNWSLPEPE